MDINSNATSGIAAALALGRAADTIVLALGIDKTVETEGTDRADTALPGEQQAFATQVLALGKPTVLVLVNGGALAIDALVARAARADGSIAPYAIVEAFNPNVAGTPPLAATLFGKENRWGKLPVTMYPHHFIDEKAMTDYDMSAGVGRTYKYYTGAPLFAFGHGLSYTTFEVACTTAAAAPPVVAATIACAVRNTGGRDGDEVVQLYHAVGDAVRKGLDHPAPRRALIDFARVSVAAGGVANVSFVVEMEALKVVNKTGARHLYPGEHRLYVARGAGGGDDARFSVNGLKFLRLSSTPRAQILQQLRDLRVVGVGRLPASASPSSPTTRGMRVALGVWLPTRAPAMTPSLRIEVREQEPRLNLRVEPAGSRVAASVQPEPPLIASSAATRPSTPPTLLSACPRQRAACAAETTAPYAPRCVEVLGRVDHLHDPLLRHVPTRRDARRPRARAWSCEPRRAARGSAAEDDGGCRWSASDARSTARLGSERDRAELARAVFDAEDLRDSNSTHDIRRVEQAHREQVHAEAVREDEEVVALDVGERDEQPVGRRLQTQRRAGWRSCENECR